MSENKIRIGNDFCLPAEDITTQTFGILAVRGAGKSNLATVMAEEMYRLGLPFVAVDPVGAWWGLRSSGDGKKAGLEIPIFGGRHGDVPLEKTGGNLIADLVVDQRLSCVLDVREMSKDARTKFLIDFADRLYRRNTQPIHLFLEEAAEYIPQKPFRDEVKLLSIWDKIVRLGRASGIGVTMITQRSAVLNKNVLTQVETLFTLRITAPQDRKAIAAWVEYQAQSKELLESLPGLDNGEAWVWSPQWLKVTRKVKIRRRTTFDSGATPKHSRKAPPAARMADVDLGKVRELMAGTIERARQDDPRALRKELAEAKREIVRLKSGQALVCNHGPEIAQLTSQIANLEQIGARAKKDLLNISNRLESAEDTIHGVREAIERAAESITDQSQVPKVHVPAPATRRAVEQKEGTGIPVPRPTPPLALESDISGPQRKILNALAQFEALGLPVVNRITLAAQAGYSANGGAFNNPLGNLRILGLVEYPADGVVALTDAGRSQVEPVEGVISLAELHQRFLGILDGPKRKLLTAILQAYPGSLSREELADRAGYSPSGGAFNNPLGRLRSMGLVTKKGPISATKVLFPEGLA